MQPNRMMSPVTNDVNNPGQLKIFNLIFANIYRRKLLTTQMHIFYYM